MFQRRWILLGLMAALLFVGKRMDDHRRVTAAQVDEPANRTVAPDSLADTVGVASRSVIEATRGPAVVAARAAVELPAESAAIIAEVVHLQQLAQDSDLELSPEQWIAFAAVTRDIQEIRQAYEASIASASSAGQGKYRVEVPVYAAAGDALRAKFQAALHAELGDATAGAILASMGQRLEGYFGGFGVSAQTVEIAAAAARDPDCVVTRTVRYWNSVEGSERLATRRETHFPTAEDPNGEMWGPFLELAAQATGG
jgi:hypothetical protein